MSQFKFFSVLLFLLELNYLVGMTPDEGMKIFTRTFVEGNDDALPKLCVSSGRKNICKELKQHQDIIKKYLQQPSERSEKFREHTLFFFRGESGEMILVFNNDGLLAASPLIHNVPLPQLSKKQMQEDFDFLLRKMEETFPLDEVNRQVFGLDFRQVLNSYRMKIREDMSIFEFMELVTNALNDCKGNHLWTADIHALLGGYPAAGQIVAEFIAPTVESGAIEITHSLSLLANLGKPSGVLTLRYWGGEYYNRMPLVWEKKEYPAGMKLIAIDGEAVAAVLARLQPHLSAYDLDKKLFIGQSFTRVNHNIYLLCNNAKNLTFLAKDGEEVIVDLSSFNRKMQKTLSSTPLRITKSVRYLKDQEILYIRIPQMLINETGFYLKEIKEQGKDRNIRAVVLDVRGNAGGSDNVWLEILQALIHKEYSYTTKMAFVNSESIRSYLEYHAAVVRKFFPEKADSFVAATQDMEEATIPFLGNRTFLVSSSPHRLTPSPDSLRLDCPVYIIAHDIYSSTGGLVSVAAQLDFMTSVGLPSTDSLGKGIDPLFYSLPHSKIIFSNSPEIDLTNCQSAFDVLHLRMENELNLSAEEYFNYLNSQLPDNPEEFLTRHDPFFRRIRELLNQRKQ